MKHPNCRFTDAQIVRFMDQLAPGENGCIVWVGCADANGYGKVTIAQKGYPAHRVAFEIANGPIPRGLIVRHKCDFPPCCSAAHLELGTHKQNSQDMVRRGRCNPPRGERSALSKLTLEQVKGIKRDLIEGKLNQREIAEKNGVWKSTVNAIRLGVSWANVEPLIPDVVPLPNRKMLDQDYLDIRQKWRDGHRLKQLAAEYGCRVDTIQGILRGRIGKNVPVGERVIRFQKPRLSDAAMAGIHARYVAGQRLEDLWTEFGMSRNGMYLRMAKFKAQIKEAA